MLPNALFVIVTLHHVRVRGLTGKNKVTNILRIAVVLVSLNAHTLSGTFKEVV